MSFALRRHLQHRFDCQPFTVHDKPASMTVQITVRVHHAAGEFSGRSADCLRVHTSCLISGDIACHGATAFACCWKRTISLVEFIIPDDFSNPNQLSTTLTPLKIRLQNIVFPNAETLKASLWPICGSAHHGTNNRAPERRLTCGANQAWIITRKARDDDASPHGVNAIFFIRERLTS